MGQGLHSVMNSLKRPFKKPTEDEISQSEAMAEEVRRDVLFLAELSAEILADPRYGRMKNLYNKIVTNTLRLMIWYDVNPNEPDKAVAYMQRMQRYQNELRQLTNIVGIPKDFVVNAQQMAQRRSGNGPAQEKAGKDFG